jgi:hypothetical protein
MRFEWDEKKRRANIKKYGIDFADVSVVFEGAILTIPDERQEYGETRYLSFGFLGIHVIVVAHTDENDVIRIISARKATKHEEENFLEEIGY